jgi:VIT1/CCC1 family predicted Fe2+/Mn2+ transporter
MLKPQQQQKLLDALQANWKAECRGFFIYSHLADREAEASARRDLRALAAAEKHHADLWADRLHALGGTVPSMDECMAANTLAGIGADTASSLRSLELDESSDIARYGEQLQQLNDEPSLEILHRVIKDEQEHYRVLQRLTTAQKPEVVDEAAAQRALDALLARRDKGRVQAGSWIGDAIYGVNDGLGSIFGIVSGVSGATLGNSHFVLIAGLAGMIASALSMGSGAYLAAKSEREIYQAEFAREEAAVRLNPVEARELLSLSYQARGLPRSDADRVVEHLSANQQRLAEALARERLNTTEAALAQPWTSAISGALSTAVGAFIPVVPFFFTSGIHAVVIAAIVSLLAHFAVGAAKTLITNRSWWSSGLEMTWVGALEGGITYAIGIALGHIGGGS